MIETPLTIAIAKGYLWDEAKKIFEKMNIHFEIFGRLLLKS